MGGIGVGMYRFSLINGNPAGNVFLGKQYSLGIAIFNPNRQYTVTGAPSGIPGTFGLLPGTIESDSRVFVIPNLGANWTFGSNDNNAFGIAIYGNGGMNTDYPTQTFFDQNIQTTGVNLAQLFSSFTYSRKLSPRYSVGISAIAAYQSFKAEGLSNFAGFSSDATSLTNNDDANSFGFGLKLGIMGEVVDGLTLGALYQSKIYMSEFDEYSGLFAEQGDFDIPASWTVGLAYAFNEKFTLGFDVKQILYSGIASVSNPMDLTNNAPTDRMGNPNPNFQPLGADDAWGFGWEDMTILKVGAEYRPNDDWAVRAGYSFGNQPIPDSEVLFNILAPGVIENHLTFGLSRSIGNSGSQIHFSFNYAFNNTVSGSNPLDFDAEQAQQGVFVPNQTIDLEMNQLDFEVGFTF